jgi:hypothetical protein
MEQLTKQEKLKIYKLALEIYKKEIGIYHWVGLCNACHQAMRNLFYFCDIENCLKELMDYKPIYITNNHTYWWPVDDHEIRIKILEEIINKLKQDVEQQ